MDNGQEELGYFLPAVLLAARRPLGAILDQLARLQFFLSHIGEAACADLPNLTLQTTIPLYRKPPAHLCAAQVHPRRRTAGQHTPLSVVFTFNDAGEVTSIVVDMSSGLKEREMFFRSTMHQAILQSEDGVTVRPSG